MSRGYPHKSPKDPIIFIAYENRVPFRHAASRPEAEKVLIELIRKASISQRIDRALSLTRIVSALCRRAIRRENPSYSRRELDVAFVRLHYGEKLADELKKYLADQKES